MSDYTAILGELKQKRDKLRAEYESELRELNAAISAIEKLIPPSQMVAPNYRGLSFREAAVAYLGSQDGPRTTRQILDALLAGGLTSEAENPTNSLYSVLQKSDEFAREGNNWKLSGEEQR